MLLLMSIDIILFLTHAKRIEMMKKVNTMRVEKNILKKYFHKANKKIFALLFFYQQILFFPLLSNYNGLY